MPFDDIANATQPADASAPPANLPCPICGATVPALASTEPVWCTHCNFPEPFTPTASQTEPGSYPDQPVREAA
jgi:hypothetical protein